MRSFPKLIHGVGDKRIESRLVQLQMNQRSISRRYGIGLYIIEVVFGITTGLDVSEKASHNMKRGEVIRTCIDHSDGEWDSYWSRQRVDDVSVDHAVKYDVLWS